MNRLARDWKAFAARVKMGRARSWVVLEGRDGDRAFYDELGRTEVISEDHPIEFILAEEISIEGKAREASNTR